MCYEMTSRYLCSDIKNDTSFQNKLSKVEFKNLEMNAVGL